VSDPKDDDDRGRPAGWTQPLTIQQLARIYGIGRKAMSRWLHNGELPARKVGSRWMIRRDWLPADAEL